MIFVTTCQTSCQLENLCIIDSKLYLLGSQSILLQLACVSAPKEKAKKYNFKFERSVTWSHTFSCRDQFLASRSNSLLFAQGIWWYILLCLLQNVVRCIYDSQSSMFSNKFSPTGILKCRLGYVLRDISCRNKSFQMLRLVLENTSVPCCVWRMIMKHDPQVEEHLWKAVVHVS